MAVRDTNDYGKTVVERDRILHDLATHEPMLRSGAMAEIDTRTPLHDVVTAIERVAAHVSGG